MALSITSIIIIALGAIDLLCGLASIFTHNVYLMSNTNEYTEGSLAQFSLPLGICNVLCGTGFILCELLTSTLFKVGKASISTGMVAMPVLLILGLLAYLAGHKVLVKKAMA